MYPSKEISQQYKKIKIQQLQKREQQQEVQVTRKDLLHTFNHQEQQLSGQVLFYKDSGIGTKRLIEQSGSFRASHFFNAFAHAYSNHGDVVLVPDEIWIMISFYMSKYIDRNAHKLRKKLVKHEGVKNLVVQQIAESVQQSLMMEKNWDTFFEEIIKSIEKQIVEGVVQSFQCDFSTTNKIYKTISTSIIMNSMKNFFRYERDIGFACGINNVYMAGTREDWAKMIPKLENLIQYDVDGDVKQYISHMRIILQNFLDTYDNKPSVEWWNTIMTTLQRRFEYFSEELQIQGWILNFFGMYEKQVLEGFPQMGINVPIVLKNELTQTQKNLQLISDWVSVSKLDNRTYKADVGVVIVEKL